MSSGEVDGSSSAIQEYNESKQDTALLSGGHQYSGVLTSPSYSFGFVPPMLGTQLPPFDNSESQTRDASRLPSFIVRLLPIYIFVHCLTYYAFFVALKVWMLSCYRFINKWIHPITIPSITAQVLIVTVAFHLFLLLRLTPSTMPMSQCFLLQLHSLLKRLAVIIIATQIHF